MATALSTSPRPNSAHAVTSATSGQSNSAPLSTHTGRRIVNETVAGAVEPANVAFGSTMSRRDQ